MWQPPSYKHLYENTGSYANAIPPPDEIPGHLLHLQKLQLSDFLSAFSATPNNDVAYLINNLTPGLVNNLQKYLKNLNRSAIMTPNLNQCSSTTFNDANSKSSNTHLMVSAATKAVSLAPASDPSIFLSPPPPPPPTVPAVSTVLDMLPLDILTDTFIRLNALHLTNPNLATSLNSSNTTQPSPCYYSSGTNSPRASHIPLQNPLQIQLFKQYLNMEQQHLQQMTTLNNPSTTTSLPTIDGYYNFLISKGLHLSSSSINCDRNHRTLRKRKDDLKDLSINSNSRGDEGDDLLPPPKKKWIRHYLKEVANNNNANATSFMLLTNSTTSKLSATSSLSLPRAYQEQDEAIMKQNLLLKTKTTGPTTTTFTLIDSNGEIVRNAAASKQMLLTNGIRIASSSATIGQQQQHNVMGLSTKAINIPLSNKTIPILSGFPYQLPTQQQQQQSAANAGGGSSGSMILSNRHKTFTPLTPPPMSSRKFVEPTHSRIRSFSLSSHKISANNHQLHVQNHNNNNNNSISMMVDEIPPTQQQHPGFTTSSIQHSPPRHASAGASSLTGMSGHYMHMQTGTAGHVTPRRRTISSTSNGAGTREVHNKLEKNRRAHLKECYEALKNQLSLKDEDRRKTSNLAILSEALKTVQTFQKRNSDLEAEWEHLANEKINFQKRIVSLKRELGPKYEQIFSGIFPDIEIGSIPSERETINDTHSLSSGRGSTLYSSSSSLSSGGSNGSSSGSNTMSSPVGAGLQTTMPTAISPVITKINTNNNNTNNINSTSPISITSNNAVMQQQRKNPSMTTTIQAVAIPPPTQGAGNSSPPAGSPTTLVTFGSSLPLSLTAKNISATAVTRGSPTPSTPSPSPSSSSGVSSSSSLISSSPPINGVISNGRNVTVNIPNGLILQAAAASGTVNGGGGVAMVANTLAATIGNGTPAGAATIIASAAPAQGVNNTNNAVSSSANQMTHQQQQQYNGRKKSLTLCNNNNNVVENHQHHHHVLHQHQQQQTSEDGEQPAKFLKVFNSTTNGLHQEAKSGGGGSGQPKLLLTGNGGIGGVVSNNNVAGSSLATSICSKSISNGSACASITTAGNELCRLPGGAELNILPSKTVGGGPVAATPFYHANGKITFINGSHNTPHHQHHHHPPSPMPNCNASSNGTTVTNGFLLKDATPLLVSSASSPTSTTNSVNGLHFAGNFAQLLAAANTTASSNNSNGPAAALIFPMTSFQSVAETKTKNNSKSSVVTWRSGAATTN